MPNKITADIKALAQVHAESAIRELATILTTSENDQARIAAAKELLDRGFGKSTQHAEITGKDGGPIKTQQAPVDLSDLTDEELQVLERLAAQSGADQG
ncbi:hypothetical protein [Paraburkholderia sp. RL18-085-BIA-A]|uniref:hypothetical protein n=1 Tax=Paraburkholderia sp. RL18-085-BIA-A TaxID=3031633 RepID=UPI0038BA1F3A